MIKKKITPAVLIILDGWGIQKPSEHNAITLADPPEYGRLIKEYSHTKLLAHGTAVGLPEGQVGNSEAGHLNIGAGRVVKQDSLYISDGIEDGTFYRNPAFISAFQHVKKYNSRLHLMGILSGNQCPHMTPDHIIALLNLSVKYDIKDVVLSFFTDGRDSPPNSALEHWNAIKDRITPNARVGSVAGRLYLDRKKKWDRTETLYDMLTSGIAVYTAASFEEAIAEAYKRGETDEFISPTKVESQGKDGTIKNGDAVIFYNLRSDRARQLTRAFVQQRFEPFNRKAVLDNLSFVAMTDFGPDLDKILTAYPSRTIKNSLTLALKDFRQLYIAEMEKYAHVTFFINGGFTDPVAGEKRTLVRSKDVKSYDDVPEMSAREINQVVLPSIEYDIYDFICINYANADMIGHTGNLDAAIKAIKVVDECVFEVVSTVLKKGGFALITSDHGNAEYMVKQGTGELDTMHEISPVPLILVDANGRKLKNKTGKLADVAPTLLYLLGVDIPMEMTGESLVK